MAENTVDYSETDPNNRIAIDSATQITVTGMSRNEDCYLYRDMGVGHFNDFEHLVSVEHDGVNAIMGYWAISDIVDDFLGMINGDADGLVGWTSNGYFRLTETKGSTSDATAYLGAVTRHLTPGRSGTAATVKVYTDAARTTLADTLAVTDSGAAGERYAYWTLSYNSGHAASASGVIYDLDLQEAEAAAEQPGVFAEAIADPFAGAWR